jgi:hypothetical protein
MNRETIIIEDLKVLNLYESVDQVSGEVRYYTIDNRTDERHYSEEIRDYKREALTSCESFATRPAIGSRILTKEDNV